MRRLLDYLSKKGVGYTKAEAPAVGVTIGGEPVGDTSPEALDAALAAAGYDLSPVVPSALTSCSSMASRASWC
jgi:hypothetical protein